MKLINTTCVTQRHAVTAAAGAIKTTALGLVGLLALASTLALAAPGEGHRGEGHRGGKLMQQLDLSDAQREEIREIRENGGGRDEIKAVLTAEQLQQMDELRAQHRAKRGDRVARLQSSLDLSYEQVVQMREVVDSGGGRDEVRAILTPEQQAQFDEMRARHKGGAPR